MFESLKGMAGLAGLMKDLPRIQQKMRDVKERLAGMTVSAETGGGAVRAVASGNLRIVAIEFDPSMLAAMVDATQLEDRAVAEELITGAVNAALERAQSMAAEELNAAAQELGVPLPPGGLGGLGGP
jgi:DNA-binding protein YbaB